MTRVVLFAMAVGLASLSRGPSAKLREVWLVVGASDASPAVIARKTKALSRDHAGSLIFSTRDCGDKNGIFGWTTEIATSAESARQALERARATIHDAYLKRCNLVPGSLLALNFPAVDPSIADVPADAVNWSDDARVSSAITLPGDRVAVIVRYFVNEREDALEGRRERLVLVDATGKRTTLLDPCLGAGAIAARRDRLAVQCAREQAADQDLHSTFVFNVEGKQLAEISHCSKPHWVDDQSLTCSQESIDEDGQLTLQPKRTRVP